MSVKDEISKVVDGKCTIEEAKRKVIIYINEAIDILKDRQLQDMGVTIDGYTNYAVEIAKMIQREI